MRRITCAAFAFVISSIMTSCAGGDTYSGADLPIYPKSTKHKIIHDKTRHRKIVYEEVSSEFPAKEITSFYDTEMEKRGFHPFSADGYGSRRWEVFDSKTGDWEKRELPGRYIATWTDESKSTRVVLSMRYQYDAKDPKWDHRLIINLSVQPFFMLPRK